MAILGLIALVFMTLIVGGLIGLVCIKLIHDRRTAYFITFILSYTWGALFTYLITKPYIDVHF
jgi:hypothetical protein